MGDLKSNQQQETSWLLGILIAIDQLGNAIAGGNPRSTISARTGFNVRAPHCKNRKYWQFLAAVINFAFYPIDGPDHCGKAYHNDIDSNHIEGNDVMRLILSVLVIITCVPIAIFTRLYTLVLRSEHYKVHSRRSANRSVRQFTGADSEYIINYFLHADKQYLEKIGLDQDQLSSYDQWEDQLLSEESKSYQSKSIYYLIWQMSGEPIGHANVTNIHFGKAAYLHLHVWHPGKRNHGNGTWFIKQSILHFFDKFQLQELYCEPSAFNVAPNKVLSKLGFELVRSYQTMPSRMEYGKAINCWRLRRDQLNQLVR